VLRPYDRWSPGIGSCDGTIALSCICRRRFVRNERDDNQVIADPRWAIQSFLTVAQRIRQARVRRLRPMRLMTLTPSK
jgi:hypothetical protein